MKRHWWLEHDHPQLLTSRWEGSWVRAYCGVCPVCGSELDSKIVKGPSRLNASISIEAVMVFCSREACTFASSDEVQRGNS